MKVFAPYRDATVDDSQDDGNALPSPSRFAFARDHSAVESSPPQEHRGRRSVPVSNRAVDGFYLLPVPQSTVLLTLNQLAVMSQNGVEIAEAVGHVAANCPEPRLADSLTSIHLAVSSGCTFSQAVSSHGHYFPPALPAMLAAAEATGEVPETLGNVCERLRGEIEMRASIVGAMIYPVILIAAATVVMAALILGVLPQFGRVFESMGKPVPASTQFLLDVGTFGRTYWMLIFPVIAFLLGAIIVLRKSPLVQNPLGRFLLYAPLVRDAYRPLMAGRNFRTIASMVRGGVPLLQAIRLTRDTVSNKSWNHLLRRVEANLIDGLNASDALATADFLPSEATQMMMTGERTGRVPEVLDDIGRFYEQEGGRRIKRLVVTLEPMIILVMGVIVAAVVMSVMLPLLDVSTIQSRV